MPYSTALDVAYKIIDLTFKPMFLEDAVRVVKHLRSFENIDEDEIALSIKIVELLTDEFNKEE